MMGLAHKAWHAGINVVRMNQRNCGGTEELTPRLYHTGLSEDLLAVGTELAQVDNLSNIWIAGFSMGGNLTLKLAGEVKNTRSYFRGFVGVCPNIQPAVCVKALQLPKNLIYHNYFLHRLKARLQRKARHFPHSWNLTHLPSIRTMWEFDNLYTAPDGGYNDAPDYYERCGAYRTLQNIQLPTLIITAQDDPFIPFHMFQNEAIALNPYIQLVAPEFGGHCGFYQRPQTHEDGFWVENRIIEFLQIGQESVKVRS